MIISQLAKINWCKTSVLFYYYCCPFILAIKPDLFWPVNLVCLIVLYHIHICTYPKSVCLARRTTMRFHRHNNIFPRVFSACSYFLTEPVVDAPVAAHGAGVAPWISTERGGGCRWTLRWWSEDERCETMRADDESVRRWIVKGWVREN